MTQSTYDKLTRWAPTIITVGTILSAVFLGGRQIQEVADQHRAIIVHICRVEVAVHSTPDYHDCLSEFPPLGLFAEVVGQ